MDLSVIRGQAAGAMRELLACAKLSGGDIVVVGCSSSEIAGGDIGKASSPEIGEAVYGVFAEILRENGLFLAAQCCEHLNRALIIEREAAGGLQIVNAVPHPKAGGSFASAAYKAMREPVAVEAVSAAAGLDIGGTLIGMHLRRVAVPVKLKNSKTGAANVTAARTRPPFTGGSRATYDERLL